MSENLEIPKWVEQIISLWEKHHRRALPKEIRDLWQASYRKDDEELKKIDRDDLTGWQRAWFDYRNELNQRRFEKGISLRIDESSTRPKWHENLEDEVMGSLAPTVNLKALMQKRPSQTVAITFGELVGHEYMACSVKNQALEVALEKTSDEYRKAFSALWEHFRTQRLKMVNKALAIANQQPYKEARQFIRGYYLALDRGTINESGQPVGATYATPIHNVMYAYAGFLPRLKNNQELLEWLKLVLGKSQSWNENSFKRIEKITQRLDLHLGQRSKSDSSAQTMSE